MRSLIKQIHIPRAWDSARIGAAFGRNQIQPFEFGFPQNVSIRSRGAAPSSEKIFTSISKRGQGHYLPVLLDH